MTKPAPQGQFDFGDAPVGADEQGEVALPAGLRLHRNVAIFAGAGAGKTYSLVTMCLHVLGGARVGFAPLSCAELGLLTFTEKAASEMRSRLRQRLEQLAQGTGDEPDLVESFAAARLPFPSPRRWRRVRDELGMATMGTFHSLCTQVLRRAPPEAGIVSNFELLEEREAKGLMRDLTERLLVGHVDRGTPLKGLVAELGIGRLSERVLPLVARIREEGLDPRSVVVSDAAAVRAQFETELRSLREQVLALETTTEKQRQQLNAFTEVLERITFDSLPVEWEAWAASVAGARNEVGALRDRQKLLSRLHVAAAMAQLEQWVREWVVEVTSAYETTLVSRGVLDFTGLLVQARTVLRDFPLARRAAQGRFRALLVDEFQDTNRLQLELVLLLSEQRDGGPREVRTHQSIVALPQERGFLAVVGDRKQSIYEFRGADVSVFEVMAQAIERNGGGRAYLRHSRRQSPPLVKCLNAGFTEALGPHPDGRQPADFETVYQPQHDDLIAVRTHGPSGPPVLQLVDSTVGKEDLKAAQRRAVDANAVAAALSHGLAGAWTVMKTPSEERPAEGPDVAVLFQRFTHLEIYRQALVRFGVPHRVVRGRGFYAAQEVVDLASFFAILSDCQDSISLSAVLRSPLVGLTDAQWVSLAQPRGKRAQWALDAESVLWGANDGGLEAVRVFQDRYRALSAERANVGLAAMLRLTLSIFEYPVAVAASPFGEQALANLEKLQELAHRREQQGMGLPEFSQELLELADESPQEAQGEVVDEMDHRAVTLCTVHQSKGLEWPIVVLPDLNIAPRAETAPIRFDRHWGLAVAPPKGRLGWSSLSVERISDQLKLRARAEHLRLLYVAMTRARDVVVLGVRPEAPGKDTWAKDLESFEAPGTLDVASLAPPSALTDSRDVEADAVALDALVSNVRQPLSQASKTMVLPVTHLQDYQLCPQRFRLAHHWGLAEKNDAPQSLDEPSREAVRRLLEATPLALIGRPTMRAALTDLRTAWRLERALTDESLGWVENFWNTAFARGLTADSVQRAVPFALRFEGQPSAVLHGQVDVLISGSAELVVLCVVTEPPCQVGVERYRFQLGCAAVAAQRWAGQRLPVRAGVVFLTEPSPEPRFLDALPLEAFEAEVLACAAQTELSQVTGQWETRARAACEAVGCGFTYRCHAMK
jgi:ATP-dependent helicase/nuclease subunit A